MVGVGKTFLAQTLGATARRAGHSVVFTRADALLKEFNQARADHTLDKAFPRFLAPELLVIDDFGLQRLSAQQGQDLYELIIERHRRSSFIVTSNRGVDERLGLFDDPILANSALDRLAKAAHQVVIDGPATALASRPIERSQPANLPTPHPPRATGVSLAMRMYTPVAGWKSSPVAKGGINGGHLNVPAPHVS
jgi:DNA replication protein DnaC